MMGRRTLQPDDPAVTKKNRDQADFDPALVKWWHSGTTERPAAKVHYDGEYAGGVIFEPAEGRFVLGFPRVLRGKYREQAFGRSQTIEDGVDQVARHFWLSYRARDQNSTEGV